MQYYDILLVFFFLDGRVQQQNIDVLYLQWLDFSKLSSYLTIHE